jgi:hypothetical protein
MSGKKSSSGKESSVDVMPSVVPAPYQRGESPLEAFFITMRASGVMCE